MIGKSLRPPLYRCDNKSGPGDYEYKSLMVEGPRYSQCKDKRFQPVKSIGPGP